MVGYALDALREACFGGFSDRLILLDYETFVRAPVEAIGALYELLGLAPFKHDFENVSYSADAFDAALGSAGLHVVSGAVEWRPRTSVLPPDLFERFANDNFWLRPEPRLAHIPKILRLEWSCAGTGANNAAGS
jgi:sulfotransferase